MVSTLAMTMKNREQLVEGFKVVVKHLTNYKRDLVLLSLMGVFSAIAYSVEPYLVGRIFDTILEPNNIFIGTAIEMPLWLLCIILWIVTLGISNFIDWLITLKSLYLEVISHADYLVMAYNTLLDLPISFHKEENLGEVEDKINNAADGISSISSDVVQDIAPQFLTIIVVLASHFT